MPRQKKQWRGYFMPNILQSPLVKNAVSDKWQIHMAQTAEQ